MYDNARPPWTKFVKNWFQEIETIEWSGYYKDRTVIKHARDPLETNSVVELQIAIRETIKFFGKSIQSWQAMAVIGIISSIYVW